MAPNGCRILFDRTLPELRMRKKLFKNQERILRRCPTLLVLRKWNVPILQIPDHSQLAGLLLAFSFSG